MCSSMNLSSCACMALTLGVYSKSIGSSWCGGFGLNDSGSGATGKFPGHLCERDDAAGGFGSLRTWRGPCFDSFGNPLQDGCQAEQVVGHVEVPVGLERIRGGEPGALAIQTDVFVFGRNAEADDVQ